VHPGDEVIVIEPCYDSYQPSIVQLAGGVPVPVAMRVDENGYSVPWDAVAAAVTPRTRMIVVNTPHNPTGTILRQADLDALAGIVDRHRYPDPIGRGVRAHGLRRPAARIGEPPPGAGGARVRRIELRQDVPRDGLEGRLCGGAGAVDGGIPQGPPVQRLQREHADAAGLAGYMRDPAPWRDLPAFYQRKRDLFRAGLAHTRFTLLPADGTYFQCVRYDGISDLSEVGIRAVADARDQGGRDSGVGLLQQADGVRDRAVLLRQEG
jgi:methionine aminotransferase